jgi:anti-anti-sigma factor
VRIEITFKDDVAVVSLSGKFLAGSDGPFLRQKVKDLLEAGTKGLVIDFAEVPYIDSTGLGFLAGCKVTTANAGTSMVLAGVNQHVRKILDHAKLSELLVTAEDQAAAIKRVKELVSSPQPSEESSAKVRKGRRRSPNAAS